MDMVLYSLVKNKISNTPTGQIDNVGGYEIRFVEILPTKREENTLYFVLGEYKVGDKINIGGKGLEKVVFNDSIIDFGILNGNVFLDKYDVNRGLERLYQEFSDNLIVNNTVEELINLFMVEGKVETNGTSSHVQQLNILDKNDNTTCNINIDRYFNGIPSGVKDTLDIATGEYSQALDIITLDGNLNWRYSVTYGDYIEFRCQDFDGVRPPFLDFYLSFNVEKYKPLDRDENGCTLNSDFKVYVPIGNEAVECVYTSNKVLRVRILKSRLTSSSTLYVAMKNYLKENPIKIIVINQNPKKEILTDVANLHKDKLLLANNNTTKINVVCDTVDLPLVKIELPIKKS